MNPISMELARVQRNKKKQQKQNQQKHQHGGDSFDAAGASDAHHKQRRVSAMTPQVAANMKQRAQLKEQSGSSSSSLPVAAAGGGGGGSRRSSFSGAGEHGRRPHRRCCTACPGGGCRTCYDPDHHFSSTSPTSWTMRRARLRVFLYQSSGGGMWDAWILFLCFVSVGLFMLQTYIEEEVPYVDQNGTVIATLEGDYKLLDVIVIGPEAYGLTIAIELFCAVWFTFDLVRAVQHILPCMAAAVLWAAGSGGR